MAVKKVHFSSCGVQHMKKGDATYPSECVTNKGAVCGVSAEIESQTQKRRFQAIRANGRTVRRIT
ncbi:hypothetical protein SDC9_91142 [bioreactor metagenome]|uniref:Uncharacterized protein n=1 Tax=bioreactor metagenome TaxID=1076179 RepID=A0A645A3V4_9ZZZZ